MMTKIGGVALLAGMMGIAAGAAAVGENNSTVAGKRGLSPTYCYYCPIIDGSGSAAMQTTISSLVESW
jgi:aspartate aminotransferase-like enzyme